MKAKFYISIEFMCEKTVSLVLLTGMLTLMSFSNHKEQVILNEIETSVILENRTLDCFELASASADQWMLNTGGSFDDSWAVFDTVFQICEWMQY